MQGLTLRVELCCRTGSARGIRGPLCGAAERWPPESNPHDPVGMIQPLQVIVGKNRMDGRTAPRITTAPLPLPLKASSNSGPATTRLQRTLSRTVEALAPMQDEDSAL